MTIKRDGIGAFLWTSLGLQCKCGGKYAMYEPCFVARCSMFVDSGPCSQMKYWRCQSISLSTGVDFLVTENVVKHNSLNCNY